jgi:hypothetical protein
VSTENIIPHYFLPTGEGHWGEEINKKTTGLEDIFFLDKYPLSRVTLPLMGRSRQPGSILFWMFACFVNRLMPFVVGD